MYVVAVYDVEADRTRIMLKFFRRYLTHVQNSVFEGRVTEGELQEIRGFVDEALEDDESVILYELSSESLIDRTVYGEDPAEDQRFL